VTAAAGGVVAVVGEALVDFVQPGPEPLFEAFVGGSPANVAVGLARLGGDSFTSAFLAGLHPRALLGAEQREHLRAVDARTVGELLDEAVLASAFTCTSHGPEPTTAAELKAFLIPVPE
jgi:sugar/nucleoside kinase (ribokinase family)